MAGNTQNIKLSNYAAGVAVANGPAWLFNSFRDLLFTQLSLFPYLIILSFLLLIGSITSGYLMARKTGEIYQRAGITTGLLSFILYFILTIIFGFGILPFELAVALTSLVVGGGLGAKYFYKRHLPKINSKKDNVS
jgi:hypothetical protein